MKDGLYTLNVHGITSVIKYIAGEPHISRLSSKKGQQWVATYIAPERLRRLVRASDAVLAKMVEEGK